MTTVARSMIRGRDYDRIIDMPPAVRSQFESVMLDNPFGAAHRTGTEDSSPGLVLSAPNPRKDAAVVDTQPLAVVMIIPPSTAGQASRRARLR